MKAEALTHDADVAALGTKLMAFDEYAVWAVVTTPTTLAAETKDAV